MKQEVDIADMVAGELKVSRGTAYELMREALEVNNKGVDALAEQEPDLSEQGRTRSAILGNNVEAMMDAGLPFLTALETALKVYCHDTPKIGCANHDCDKCEALAEQAAEPGPPYEFERYVAGSLRAQGVRVERATTLEDAMKIAAKICPPANPPSWPTVLVYTRPVQPNKTLTDEQCDAIYTALDEWSREVDARDFGLPTIAGGGMEKGREIIRVAHNITSTNKGE